MVRRLGLSFRVSETLVAVSRPGFSFSVSGVALAARRSGFSLRVSEAALAEDAALMGPLDFSALETAKDFEASTNDPSEDFTGLLSTLPLKRFKSP